MAGDGRLVMPLSSPPAPTHEEEEHELARLLERPEISRSANLVRLLTYICSRYFEGRTGDLRESAIAVHALGRRPETFDSQSDPIVRVTARTLRKRLDRYYRTEGRADRVRLELPTGQYVPRFLRCEPGPVDLPERAGDERPSEDSSFEGAAPGVAGTSSLPPLPATRAEPDPGRAVSREESRSPARPGLVPRSWRRGVLVGAVGALCALSFWLGRQSRPPEVSSARAIEVWTEPVWSDEFDGPEGAPPDADKWAYETGNNDGWGNREQEVYCAPGSTTPSPCDPAHPNAFQDGQGHLVIQAVRTPGGTWTSARLKTQTKRVFQYGRVEARLRCSVGAGLWPAFWMLGANVDQDGWPASGSVTLMENVSSSAASNGLGRSTIRATIHGPGYSGANGLWQNYTLGNRGRVDDEGFHVYGAIWSPDMIQFYVDDPSNVFCVRGAADVPAGAEWVFNHPFFLVVNLAVGGFWPGSPDTTTPDPARVWVDYVRVYEPSPVPGPALSAPPLHLEAGRAGRTFVNLNAAPGTGRVSLSCSGAPPHASCALSPAFVDLSDSGTQSTTLTVTTRSGFGDRVEVTPPGSYAVTVSAVTVSGQTSTLTVPLRVD